MNPITSKLQKLFGQNKKSCCTFQSTLSQSFNTSEHNITLPQHCTKMAKHDKKSQIGELEKYERKKRDLGYSDANKENMNIIQNGKYQENYLMQRQLEKYKNITKSLQQKIQDHQLLEDFYLQKLRERDENEKQLKWKLSVIGEEIRKNHLTSLSARDWISENDGERGNSDDF